MPRQSLRGWLSSDLGNPPAAASHYGSMSRERIASLDVVRGVVMILMAIDHVRVYAGVPAGGQAPGVFFTRWITHFVAPAFVFLAGTAAYLHGRRLPSRGALSRFLLTRGLWLLVLELTVIRVSWTFNFDFRHYMLAGVIWVIGWSMIVLAAAVHLPRSAVAAIGIATIALHNATDFFRDAMPADPNPLLKILYMGGGIGPLFILYVLIPWAGVMMAGYAFGAVMERPPDARRRFALRLGAALTLLFVVLRALDVYGDPRHWRDAPSLLRFLNTTKYPASLLFLLMTLGPMFLLLAAAEKWRGRAAGILTTFGRVPMFYYLLHIPLIHAAACIVSIVREGRVDSWLFGNHPVDPPPLPPGYMWSLPLLYLVFALCVIALYFPCRWYAGVRAKSGSKWLSYL
ncbi:MAG TPA: heparan-alpha-glucosaminide N-acetyltransferase domain-containing protein [Thermoanaerobaculia bacterium]|nr:heparan-alpha-glucosaminide N-acetyltransferase domain-containing protein [Thermoanaerobaculia bacterium]